MSETGTDAPYWSQDAPALAAALGTGLDGLTAERAAAQFALVGRPLPPGHAAVDGVNAVN